MEKWIPTLIFLVIDSQDAQYMAPTDVTGNFTKYKNLSNIMHINARSVSSKMTDFQIIMDQLPVSILALTETWLTEESEYLLSISGNTTICSSRTGRTGGGVALVLRQDIVFHILNFNFSPAHSAYESLFVSIHQQKGRDLILGVIYRPLGQPLEQFNQEMAILVSMLAKRKSRVILAGAFNVDLLKLDANEQTHDFLNILSSSYLAPAINAPTRVTETTATLIDNFFTNCTQDIIDPTIIISDFSDHFPIMLWLANASYEIKDKTASGTFRVVTDTTIEQFSSALSNEEWINSYIAINKGNTALAYDHFIKTCTELYNKYLPLKTATNKKVCPKKPWMTPGLLTSCRKKDKMYLKYKKTPTPAKFQQVQIYSISKYL